MIVKAKNMRASRVSRQQAASALSSHAKYLQYRERDPEHETKADRQFFNDEHDAIDRRWVVKDVLNEQEQAGDIYYHRIILSPSQEEPVSDWREWTREIMADLEDRFDQDLKWYAVHHANTDDPHVHVIVQGSGIDRETGDLEPVTFTPDDFRMMRESGRDHSEYEHQHFLAETWQELDERDTIGREEPERELDRSSQSVVLGGHGDEADVEH
jgi:hypothetical protein